jgi:hypothetical protein
MRRTEKYAAMTKDAAQRSRSTFCEAVKRSFTMDAAILLEMDRRIQSIKKSIIELQDLGQEIEAVRKNLDRVLASIRMLELNVSDLIPLLKESA